MIGLSGCADKEGATYVEGLLYLDGFPEVFLAPGLIDIQVNGYMGMSIPGFPSGGALSFACRGISWSTP
jgi:hypothetical protein